MRRPIHFESALRRPFFAAAALGVVLLLCTACIGSPATPAMAETGWATYSHSDLDWTLEYPDVYSTDDFDKGSSVAFRYDGPPAIRVSWLSEEEGRNRGLWFDHNPVGEITLGGLEGLRYSYIHTDGPFGSPTRSWVVPYRGKYLALEFRTENVELNDVQRRTLESFSLNGSVGLTGSP